MLRLPRLQYLRPRSIAEATELAAQNPGAMFIAGGTDLVPNLKRRQFDVTTLISLNALPDGRRVEGDVKHGVTIGGGATLDALAQHDLLAGPFRALAQACGSVSTPQVRYMGTLGGNLLVDPRCNYYNQTYSWRKAVGFCMKKDGDICLVARSSPRCWAVSSSDSAPAALALNAHITLRGVKGTRRIPSADLYKDDGIDYTTKTADEIITAVELPAVEGRMTSAYWKLRRRPAFDFPILGVAVAIAWDEGVVREARGALGAVGSHPVDITAFLKPLHGKRPADDLIADVANAADKPSRPLDNTDLSHYWRKRMSKVYIERALRDACGLDPLGGLLTAQVASR
ncbi:MAG TPA: FAD binding domain-containing protein [Candidatus Dormibacteraeota bacterium]|nr:FAD binding domain-containing protein [Candidatus Dormibacteraeota bacterium]